MKIFGIAVPGARAIFYCFPYTLSPVTTPLGRTPAIISPCHFLRTSEMSGFDIFAYIYVCVYTMYLFICA